MSKKITFRKVTKGLGAVQTADIIGKKINNDTDIQRQLNKLKESVNTLSKSGEAEGYKGSEGDIKINKIGSNKYEFYIRGEDGWHRDNNAAFAPLDSNIDLGTLPTVNMTSGQVNYSFQDNQRLTLNLDPTKVSTASIATPTIKGFGNLKFESTGNTILQSALQMKTVANAGTDPDKFLVLDASDNVKYRTGSQMLTDLGITANEIIDWTTDQGSTNINANNIVISHNEVTDFDSEVNALAQVKIDALVDSAPGALDTLNELAAALGDDANFATTVTNSIATKVGLTGDETVAGHKKFSDDVLIAGAAADPGTDNEVSLGVSASQFRVRTNHGYVQIGPSNTNWSHFYTDRDRYYFNKPVTVDGEYIASYDEDLVLRRVYNDTSYNQITIGDDSFEIKLDNTSRFNIDGSGNIAVTGTVDGRDLATDGSKLDGIEAGATADQTGPEIAAALNTDLGGNFYIGNQSDDMAIFSGAVKAVGTLFAYRQNYPQLALSDDNGTDKMYVGVSGEHAYIEFMDNQGAGAVNTLRFRGDDQTGSGDYSNADVMAINFANNRVGINTTAPGAALDVQGTGWASKGIRVKSTTTSGAVLELENTQRGFEISSRDNGFNIRDTDGDTSRFSISSGGNFTFLNGSTSLVRISSDGKLGIGTTSPDSPLHVQGTGDTSGTKSFEVDDSGGTNLFYIRDDGMVSITHNYLFVQASGGIYSTGSIKARGGITDDEGDLGLGSGGNVNHMTISSGNVGIGTTTPDANLQIHSTSGTKLWLTADGSNPADAASLRFAESENGNNYIQLSYDGSANTLSVDSNNNNDMSVWDRVNNRVTHGASTRFYRAWPQVRFSDDSGTDYVDAGLTNNTFLTKSSDADIDFQWHNSSAESILYLDSGARTVTIGEGAQSTYALKIGNNGRMNMPLKGLEFEANHGYFAETGNMFLPLFINATQTDLIRFQTPITWEYWDYTSSAWVDDTSNLGNLKNMLDGRRATSYSVSNTKRKFRFVIERASTWADDHLFYIENTWSSITSGLSWNTAAAGGNPLTPTMQVERLDGTFDDSDDSNNDWTTNSGLTTNWHTTGIVTGFGLMMYYSTGMHNAEKHIRVTVTIPEYADTSKTFAIKNIGVMSSYSSVNTNQQPFLQDFDRNATGYGHINIPSGHEYKINSVSKLSATTLGSGVVNSSLTNVGTLTGLTSSGAVNINGTSGSMLNVTNTGDTALITLTQQSASSGRANLKFNTNGGDWELGARNAANSLSNAFYIYENDSTAYRLVIADGGHIGIGTTTPSQKLHVIGSVKVDGDVIIDADHKLKSNTDDTWNFIEFDDDSGSPENQTLISSKTNTGVIVDGNNNGTGQFEVLKGGTDGTATELFRIENDGDAVFTGDVYIPGEKKIQFDSADTTIYTNSDNPEDLYIEADEDIYIRPDDNLVIACGTTNYVTFDGTNKRVGINTTSPGQGLHVVDGGGIVAEFESSDSTTATIHIENSAGEDGYIGVTNDGLVFSGQDYNSNNMIVDTSGNVGIGTTSPSAELHISTSSPYPSLLLESTGNSANIMRFTTTDGTFTVGQDYDDNFSIANASNITSDRVFTILKSNGNLGLGTTSPTTTLDVEGTVSYKKVNLSSSTDALDVSGATTVVVSTASGNVLLGGFANGVEGQIIYVVKRTITNTLRIENDESPLAGSNQKIYTSTNADKNYTNYGGMTLYCDGNNWFEIGS